MVRSSVPLRSFAAVLLPHSSPHHSTARRRFGRGPGATGRVIPRERKLLEPLWPPSAAYLDSDFASAFPLTRAWGSAKFLPPYFEPILGPTLGPVDAFEPPPPLSACQLSPCQDGVVQSADTEIRYTGDLSMAK